MNDDENLENEISEEVKKELIDILRSMHFKEDGCHEDVAANMKKHFLPQAVIILFGSFYSRNELVEIVKSKIELSVKDSVHSHKFIAAGDTILVKGLYNQTSLINGEKVESHDSISCDTFVLTNGEWRLLSSIISYPPKPDFRS